MTRNKLLIVGTGAFVGIAVIAALIFLYVTVWSQPTKKDFAEAKVIAEKIGDYEATKRFQEFAAAISVAAKESKTYDQIVDASKDEKAALISALNSRSESAAKLEKSRILKDEQVNKVYTTYAAREKIYNSFFKNYSDAYPTYASSIVTCAKVYRVVDQTDDAKAFGKLHAEASTECLKELKVLTDGPFKPLADYGKEYTRIINARQKAFDGFAAGTISSSAASQTLKQLGAESAKNDPNDALAALQEASLFHGELTALIKVLDEKAEQAE